MKTERDKFLTPKQCEEMIAHVKKQGAERDYLLLLLGMNLAGRVGEIVRFRVVDFNEKESFVRVPTLKRLSASQKAEKRKAKREAEEWKKPEIPRGGVPDLYMEVPLDPAVFSEVKRYVKKNGLKEWLFPSRRDDLHICERQAERIFKRWAQEMGFPEEVSIHSLRHSRGVDLMEKGLDTTAIKEMLRHESEASTMFYKHLTPSHRAEMLKKVGSLGIGGRK